jgi:FkbM family methyltransferase
VLTYPELAGLARRLLRRSVRVDLLRFDHRHHPVARRMRLMKHHRIDLVFDVGANAGQYAQELRELGYQGRIVSFEPLSSAAGQLRRACGSDPRWTAHQIALGDRPGRATLHVAANSTSSSLLDMLPAHRLSAPESTFTTTEEVEVTTLDDVAERELRPGERLLLKIDAQGYERKILDGGMKTVRKAEGIQIELSLVPLYQGAPLLPEMLSYLESAGFRMMSVEPVHCDRQTGQLLQMDGLFFRQ